MAGFPEPILDAAFGPGTVDRQRRTVVNLRREAHQLHLEAEAVRRDPAGGAEADATATVLEQEAAEIAKRIDGAEVEQHDLSPEAEARAHEEVDAMFDPDDDCGGWTWDPPCGGCIRCAHMQVSYAFDQARKAVTP